MRDGSRRDVMTGEKISGQSTFMTGTAPICTGTLPKISIDSASETLKISGKGLIPEGVYATIMNKYEACTTQKSPFTVAPLEPGVTQIALQRSYSDNISGNIIPRTLIHLRSKARLPSLLDMLPLERMQLGGLSWPCNRMYPKTG